MWHLSEVRFVPISRPWQGQSPPDPEGPAHPEQVSPGGLRGSRSVPNHGYKFKYGRSCVPLRAKLTANFCHTHLLNHASNVYKGFSSTSPLKLTWSPLHLNMENVKSDSLVVLFDVTWVFRERPGSPADPPRLSCFPLISITFLPQCSNTGMFSVHAPLPSPPLPSPPCGRTVPVSQFAGACGCSGLLWVRHPGQAGLGRQWAEPEPLRAQTRWAAPGWWWFPRSHSSCLSIKGIKKD